MTPSAFRLRPFMSALAAAFLFQVGAAQAAPIPVDLMITGDVDFDEGFSFGGSSGDFGVTSGGATIFSLFSGSAVVGPDPLGGPLTETGDGVGASGSAAVTGDEFAAGLDLVIAMSNASATDTYEVTFGVSWSNFVHGDSSDAFSDSEASVSVDGGEVWFTDLLSDSFFGDEVAGVATGGFGDLLVDSDSDSFVVSLAPGASVVVDGFWTAEGGEFFGDGVAALDFSMFLGIIEVSTVGAPSPVPAPGALLLMGIALAGIGLGRRARTRRALPAIVRRDRVLFPAPRDIA